jgi:hypothetical protein
MADRISRDLVNAIVGAETLTAEGLSRGSITWCRKNGNPSLDNLAAIISLLRRKLGIELDARSVEAAK